MWADVRYALRCLRRAPGFAVVAILSLGLGIGVNTAMFSLVDAVLLRPLPVADPHALVDVFTTGGDGDEYATTSYPDFLDLKARNTVFTDMIAYSPMFAPLGLGDRPRLVMGQVVTSNHFEMLGVRALVGRTLQPADDRPNAERVVMLSHRLWVREFGADAGAIGRDVQLRGQAYTIVGVAPASFTGVIPLLAPELWLPIAHVEDVEPAGISDAIPSPTGTTRLDRRGTRWLFAKGRLKPGVTAAEAHANISVVGHQLASAHPQTNRDRKIAAVPTRDVRMLVPQASGPMTVGSAAVMAVVGLVLLIACANVAGMLLARASSRRQEIALRAAIGASRFRLVRQLLVESTALGLLGSVVALAIAWGVIRVLLAIELPLPGTLGLDLRLDGRVLAYALTAAGLTGLVAGLAPALRASRPSLTMDLRGDVPVARFGGRRWTLQEVMVSGQLAFTAVLMVISGLLVRNVVASRAADVGFRTDGLALVAFDTDMVRYPTERGRQFWDTAVQRVRALPGIERVALATPRLPFDLNFSQMELRIDGRSYAPDQRGEIISNAAVSSDYFATLGLAIVDGRGILESDIGGSTPVAVINQTMARRYWPGTSPVGRGFTVAATKARYEIVGVVADHKLHAVSESPIPYVHFAAAQRPSSYNFIVARTSGDASRAVESIRRELLSLEPGLVFINSGTMDEKLATTLLPARAGAALALAFGGLGLLLAAVGLYGVIAYAVSRRTREIGLRMALGADRGAIVRLMMARGLLLAVASIGGGLVLAAAAAGALGPVLYGVGPFDPLAWGSAILVTAGVAALANALPTIRAARVSPMTALRGD